MPKVLNKRKNTPKEYRPHKDAVYVGRPTVWGNPFNGKDRIKNINDFRVYALKRLSKDPKWLDPLKGKDLVCWCAPNDCHADVILELIENQ